MKIFIDSANVEEIRKASSLGVVDGVTTNPSLLAKEKGDPRSTIAEICSLVPGPVSAEVIATEADAMVREGTDLARIHKNVVVKVPMTAEGLKACRKLSGEGLRVNVTLVFSPLQALLAARAGAYFVSPFVGRLDDISERGMDVVALSLEIFQKHALKTQVLAASLRHPLHVLESARLGAHAATMPYKVFEQMLKHPLTDIGLERFLADWKAVQKK